MVWNTKVKYISQPQTPIKYNENEISLEKFDTMATLFGNLTHYVTSISNVTNANSMSVIARIFCLISASFDDDFNLVASFFDYSQTIAIVPLKK